VQTTAAVLREIGTPLRLEEVELLPPGPREVRLRMVSSGVCHSDLHIVQGHIPVNLPIICGHEGAGVVEEVGSAVTRAEPGDHAVLSWVSACGMCRYCATGRPALCETAIGPSYAGHLTDGTSRFRDGDGNPISHHLMISSFARDVVVPEGGVVVVPADVPLAPLAVVGCAVATGIGAAVNTARVELGDVVAVIGCGGVGLNAIQGAALRGAGRIIGVDVSGEKLEFARRFGATDTLLAEGTDFTDALVEMTGGDGVDIAIEAIGNPETLASAYRALRRGGTAVGVGIAPYGSHVAIDMSMMLDERNLLGCYYGSLRPSVDIPRYVELYRRGRLLVDELITAEIRHDQIDEAFGWFEDGTGLRSLVRYGDDS